MKVKFYTIVVFDLVFVNAFLFSGTRATNQNSPDHGTTSSKSAGPQDTGYSNQARDSTSFIPYVPSEYHSLDLYYAPCAFTPSYTYGLYRLRNFSFTQGFYQCQNVCQLLYGGLKIGVCFPVLNCRCLTKGLFQFKNWWSDIKEDPMKNPLVIAYSVV